MAWAKNDVPMRCPTVNDVRIHVAALVLVSLAAVACGQLGNIRVPSDPQPAAPGAPTLIVRLDWGDAMIGVRQHAADYLSDGTVIRWSNHDAPPCGRGEPCGILETNTLTATGLGALRARLAEDADLLARPKDLKPTQPIGGREVRTPGIATRFVLERAPGDRYVVSTPGTSAPEARSWVYGPDIKRLDRLAEVLLNPETTVGPEGLSHAWTTYQPAKMAVFVWVHTIAPKPTQDGKYVGMAFEAPQPFKLTGPWPFDAGPRDFGMDFPAAGDRRGGRCGFVDSADIEALTAIVPPGAGGTLAAGTLGEGSSWGSSSLAWDDRTSFNMRIVALLPGDLSASCADAYSY